MIGVYHPTSLPGAITVGYTIDEIRESLEEFLKYKCRDYEVNTSAEMASEFMKFLRERYQP